MREYLSPKEYKQAINKLNSEADLEAVELDVIRANNRRGQPDKKGRNEWHPIFSDGTDNVTFPISNGCWPVSS